MCSIRIGKFVAITRNWWYDYRVFSLLANIQHLQHFPVMSSLSEQYSASAMKFYPTNGCSRNPVIAINKLQINEEKVFCYQLELGK